MLQPAIGMSALILCGALFTGSLFFFRGSLLQAGENQISRSVWIDPSDKIRAQFKLEAEVQKHTTLFLVGSVALMIATIAVSVQ